MKHNPIEELLDHVLRTHVHAGQKILNVKYPMEKAEPKVQFCNVPSLDEWMVYDEHNKLIVLNCLKFDTLYLESGIEKAEVMLTALVLSGVMYHHYRWSEEKIVDVTIQTIHALFPDYKTLDDKWFNRHVFPAK